MRKVFHYMNELFKQLNVVKPACARTYDLPNVGQIAGLAQSDYRIEYRTVLKDNKDHFETLNVSYKRSKPEQFEVKRESELIERFRDIFELKPNHALIVIGLDFSRAENLAIDLE